ncbi:MAG TPA: SDR family NAD(P)-dependent oxidoreductase, partial [Ktedonobacteraceae bacterium]
LGELTALHWAGAIDEAGLLELARVRGAAMASLGDPTGTMIGLAASQEVVEELVEGEEVVIAGFNTPRQIVLAGAAAAVAAVAARARARQVGVIPLKVSHAFHSPLVSAAALPLADYLAGISFQPLQRPVFSTVTGAQLAPEHDLKDLLFQQITMPVRFTDALKATAERVDLWFEVGPGRVLSGLARECSSIPAFALDVDGPSSRGLCQAIGAAFAAGVPLRLELLTEGRFSRPFDLNWQPRFLANPCEQAPLPETEVHATSPEPSAGLPVPVLAEESRQSEEGSSPSVAVGTPQTETISILELLRQLVAERTELPRQAVDDHHRMLNDLHLNSITVGQIVSEAARSLGLLPPTALTEYADATLAEIAQALTELKQTGGTLELEERMKMPSGVDTWIRAFQVGLLETPNLAPAPEANESHSTWKILAPRDYPLAEALRAACPRLSRGGVLVCLPPQADTEQVALLLYGAQEILKSTEPSCFVLVHHGKGGGGVARTLALEAPKHTICVVDVPPTHPHAVAWTLAEIQAAQGYSEAVYTERGQRRVRVLQHVPLSSEQIAPLALGPNDVLLVTGGGKGIAAECAFALARETGVRLALLGRSQPARDNELAENLQRFSKAEITFRYVKADVTSAAEVEAALGEIENAMGSITALLHGAGTNTPRPLS